MTEQRTTKKVSCAFKIDDIGLNYLKFISHLWKHNADARNLRGKIQDLRIFIQKPNLIQCFSVYPSLLDGSYPRVTAKFFVVRGLSLSTPPPTAILCIGHVLDA